MTVLPLVHHADSPAFQRRVDPTRLATALRSKGFRGELDWGAAATAAMSTDGSVYRIEPDIVAAPHDAGDVEILVATLALPEFKHVPITGRGGGTGTNGQALNSGVIVDFRRHMRRVIEVNEAEGWVDVEPGVVLDELNEALEATGLFFAPNTSTSSRCTIGGMIATDASGKGSRIYGKTADNVIGIEVVVADGLKLDSLGPVPDRSAPILDAIEEACRLGRPALMQAIPHLSRRFSGYDLERALPEGGPLEWWRLFIGAEGTLGLVTKARLKLVKRPTVSILTVVAFETFTHAVSAAQELVAFEPLAIESVDEWVQRLASEAGLLQDIPPSLKGGDALQPVYNFVEFSGRDADYLEARVAEMVAALDRLPGFVGYHIARDSAEIKRLWSIRSSSVGLLGKSSTRRVPIAFVEDCVVPPQNLAAFVDEYAGLLTAHNLSFGIYGHVDVGCLHVRPALDIDDAAQRDKLKEVSDAVYELVKRHGGIFWGEHGKGVRGEYLADFVGETAYEAFTRIKMAFDPDDRFNPGKLVSPHSRLSGIATTPFRAPKAPETDVLARAFACNGNAVCLSYAKTVPMCPSFKATNDLKHSPKGRAEILKVWHAAKSAGGENLAAVEASAFVALDGCLGCNACAGSCPAHVNIPEMKSHFLADYYQGRWRPLADRVGIWLERYSGQLSKMRGIVRLAGSLRIQKQIDRVLGLVDSPSFSRSGVTELGFPFMTSKNAASSRFEHNSVLVATDPFTSLFDTAAIAEICEGLQALGYAPSILILPPGGKAAHVKGDRKQFRRQAEKLKSYLDSIADKGVSVVGADPSFVLMLRNEYANADLKPDVPVLLLQEFLLASHSAGFQWPSMARHAQSASIFMHCTETSHKPNAAADWNRVFSLLGMRVTVAATGCCGMAGLFGHESKNQDVSKKLYEMSWKTRVEKEDVVYATGFSCRCQTDRFSSRPSAHPLSLIANASR